MSRERRSESGENVDSVIGRGGPPWILTFADLCTLLLVFFVMILSMSSLNVKAIRSTFLGDTQSRVESADSGVDEPEASEVDEIIEGIRKTFCDRNVAFVEDESGGGGALVTQVGSHPEADIVIHIRRDVRKDAFTFVLSGDLLFDSVKGGLTDDGRLMLATVGAFAKDSGQQVLVDHFETASTLTAGASRDLIARRKAMTVLDYLASEVGVEPKRLGVGAYGNADAADQGRERRKEGVAGRTEITFENER